MKMEGGHSRPPGSGKKADVPYESPIRWFSSVPSVVKDLPSGTMKKMPVASSPGLCADCQFMRQIQSDRGSVFYFCERSKTDPKFPKYPTLPVLRCSGYEAISAGLEEKS